MYEFTDSMYKVFSSVCKSREDGLLNSLELFLKNKYGVDNIKRTSDYLIALGNIPVGMIAHLDTVFNTPPKNIYFDREKGVIWSPEGLGADDRAGVFAITSIINKGLRPTVIFTTGEEIGGVGATKLIEDYPKPPQKLNYLIEVDRRGTDDCVFYNCDNSNFIKYIEDFGFRENLGTFSDISIISPIWKVPGVNLSIGYEDEHEYIETFHTAPFLKTLNRIIEMLNQTHNNINWCLLCKKECEAPGWFF